MTHDGDALTVGVVIPTYNFAGGLCRPIESVLCQTRPASDIVVVNDGSADHTLDVVKSFGERVRCVSQTNRGAAAARNRGVQELHTDWVAFLDQDDTWLPQKLERQCAALERMPDAAFSSTGAYTYFEGKPVSTFIPDARRIALNFRYSNVFGSASSYMIRRDRFIALGGFREAQRNYAEDWELAARLYLHFPFCAVPEPLICYFGGLGVRVAGFPKCWEPNSIWPNRPWWKGFQALSEFSSGNGYWHISVIAPHAICLATQSKGFGFWFGRFSIGHCR